MSTMVPNIACMNYMRDIKILEEPNYIGIAYPMRVADQGDAHAMDGTLRLRLPCVTSLYRLDEYGASHDTPRSEVRIIVAGWHPAAWHMPPRPKPGFAGSDDAGPPREPCLTRAHVKPCERKGSCALLSFVHSLFILQ